MWMLFLQIMTHHIVSVEGNSVSVSLDSSSVSPTPSLTAFMMQTSSNLTNLHTKATAVAILNSHGMNTTIYSNGMNSTFISVTASPGEFMMQKSSNLTIMHTDVMVMASSSQQMNATQKLQSTNSTVISVEVNSVTLSLDASSVSPTSLLTEFIIMRTSLNSTTMHTKVPSIASFSSRGMNRTKNSWIMDSTVISAGGNSINFALESSSFSSTPSLTMLIMQTLLNSNIHTKVSPIFSSRSQDNNMPTHSWSLNSTVIPRQTPRTDKDFKYMMMGIGIGAAFLFFVVFFAVVVCMKRRRRRKPTRNYGGLSPEEVEDNFFRSKESIFSSSTLQLRGGLNNDALEMEAFQAPSNVHRIAKHGSTFQSDPDPEPENLTVHVNMEPVDIVPTGFQPTATQGLGKEINHDARIRLLQEWHEDLNNEESDMYKELKHDVEESIRDLYRMKQGFKDVNMKSIRKGSIIADLILIMLAAVTDPLDILKRSVAHGKIGSFKVDKHFPISKGANEEETDYGNNQPNLKGALSSVARNTEIDQDRTDYSRKSVASGTAKNEAENAHEPDDASGSFDNHSYENYPTSTNVSPIKSPIRGAVIEESSTDAEMPLQRPLSLADLNNPKSPLKFREQRDSGIGSMQELNKWEPHRISRQEEIPESEEQVFYESADSPRSGVKIGKEGNKKVLPKTDEESPTVAYVALYDFIGKEGRELSIKQGEVVHVISSESSGWIKVINEDEKQGWVPVCFIVLVSKTQLTNTQQTVETLEYFDNVLEELDSEKGSCSSGESSPREDGYTYAIEPSVDANIYATPEEVQNHEYVTMIPDDTLQIQVKRCKSVYAFAGKDATELSINEGEIINVLKSTETGWWKGQIDEREGWFPSSYVMPLNEQSEIALPEQTSVTDDKAKITRADSEARAKDKRLLWKDRANSTEAMYAEPDTPIQRGEHKYQSLQRTLKLPEQYAHLYFQILKRETKSDEDLPRSCKAFDAELAKNDSNLDRPIRNAPAPPKEDKPVVPPKDIIIKPKVPSKRVAQGPPKDRVGISSHGEPPKRPVPPPPTAKPIRVNSGAIKRRKSEETIFLDKQLPKEIAPPARSKYENLPEKPRHSAHFIIKENVKDPVAVVSLKNEVLKSESSKTKNRQNVSRIASVPNAAIEAKVDPSTSNVNQLSLQGRSASFPENEKPSRASEINVPLKPLPMLNKTESDNREKRPPVAIRPKTTDAEVSKPKIPSKSLPVLEKTTDMPERPIIPGKPVKQLKKDGQTGATPKLALESTAEAKPVVPVGPGLIINKDDILAKKQMLGKKMEVKNSSDKPDKKSRSSEPGTKKEMPPKRPEAPTNTKIENMEEIAKVVGSKKPLPAKRQISIVQNPVDSDSKSANEVVDKRPPKPAVRRQSSDVTKEEMKSTKQISKPSIPVTNKPPLPNIKPHVSIDVAERQSTDLMKSKVPETGVETASEKSDVKSPVTPRAKPKPPVKPSLSTQNSVEEQKITKKPIPAKRTDSQSGVAASQRPKQDAFSPKNEHKETPVPVPRLKLAKSEEAIVVKQEFEVSLTSSSEGARAKEKPSRPTPPNLTDSPKMEKPSRPTSPNVTDGPKVDKPSRPTSPNVTDSPKMDKPERPTPPHLKDSPKVEKPERPTPPHLKDSSKVGKPERPTPPHLKDSPKMEKPERPTPPHLKDSPKPASPKSRTKDKTKLRKVIKEYTGTSNKELNFSVGDMLFELDEARAQGKCYGLLENGQEGWYPIDHVERVYPDS